jgi:pimeloyl-ACP methyl ester carboxylesterase
MMAKQRSGLPAWFWLTAGAVAGWGFYSKFILDHNMPLANAIDAPRKEFFGKNSSFMSYYHDEQANGRPLVLLHSINAAASAYEMRPLVAYYRGERPVYVLDLPGFGFSERSNRDYSPELYVAAILDFLEGVVKQPADVVALSLSSEFAARAAVIKPELFHSLSLISPTGLATDPIDLKEAKLFHWLNNPVWAQAVFDLLVSKSSIRFFLKQLFVNEIDKGLVDYAYESAHQKGARFAPLSFIAGKLFTVDIIEIGYNRLAIPCLVLFDKDPNTSFDKLADILSRNSYWRARKIPNTRGLPHWEQMGQVAEALDSFWEGLMNYN